MFSEIDYLIVGQGIAGTVLAHTLLEQGQKVLVIDNEYSFTSSKASVGICNPVTGKRLTKTWAGDSIFPFLHSFYTGLEKKMGKKILYPKEVYRIFHSVEEQNRLFAESASGSLSEFMNFEVDNSQYTLLIDNPLGGWESKQACYIDTEVLLESSKEYFETAGVYQKDLFDYSKIEFEEEKVRYKSYRAKKIIFCEGARVIDNEYFNWIPLKSVKGEWLKIETSPINLQNIINQGIFLLPLGKGIWKVGATYNWEDKSADITENSREELVGKLNAIFKIPYKILTQKVGMRPASFDRRPIIGLHPKFSQLGVFNGLGTKGLSLAPYYSLQFHHFLEQRQEIDKEADLNRFIKYFPK